MPYQQTEGYRFGNAIVDDWEGKVNAWPLDEGLIDYVDADLYGEESEENPLYTANVIANPKLRIGADEVDATSITPELLSGSLQEAQGVEANVATGYHAIEFLLWGQDLHGTEAGLRRASGDRLFDDAPARTRIATGAPLISRPRPTCSSPTSKRWWRTGRTAARRAQEIAGKGPDGGLSTILTGLGSLSYGELAGERIKLGLILHDPEEEHDCFSDNTHNSHYYDEIGMAAIWTGKYTRVDGSVVEGPSIRDYATAKAARCGEARRRGVRCGGRQAAGAEGHRRRRQDGLRPDDRPRQRGGEQDRRGRRARAWSRRRARSRAW